MKKDITFYKPEEAIKQARQTSKVRFDATMELHINLRLDSKKQDTHIRYTTVLPHGTGKNVKVAVLASKKVANADLDLSESDIDKIEKGTLKPKVDFDVVVTEPRFMTKLAKVAKILGPAGVMPNPKLGTVTENPEEAVKQLKKGKVEIKLEKDVPVIHTVLGKASFDENALVENFKEIVSTLKQNKPAKAGPDWLKSIFVTSTMGPSFAIDITSL